MKKANISLLDKLLLRFFPWHAMRIFAKRMGVENVVFEYAELLFRNTKRIDFFPTHGGRGLIIVLDQQTALFFHQDKDHFAYDGFEMGKYNKGDVAVLDDVRRDVSMYP